MASRRLRRLKLGRRSLRVRTSLRGQTVDRPKVTAAKVGAASTGDDKEEGSTDKAAAAGSAAAAAVAEPSSPTETAEAVTSAAAAASAAAAPAPDPDAVEPPVGAGKAGGGAFASSDKKKQEAVSNPWDAAGRFISAGWDTFVEAATTTDRKGQKEGWTYSKGIEGMSMGSMAYELINTPENTEAYKELDKEYQRGWVLPFTNLSFRKLSSDVFDFSRGIGLDGVFLTLVNLLQTVGVSGEAVDGIPVQNKWMTIVRDTVMGMGQKDPTQGGKQINALIKNAVTGQMERIAGAPMPIFLEAYGEQSGIFKIVIGPRSAVVMSDPVLVKHVLQSSQANYTKGILSEVLEPIMGKGLIPADPVTWRERRRAIVPGFHKRWLKTTTKLISECADRLSQDIERSLLATRDGPATVNMEEKFVSVSLDIIGKAVFNYDFGSTERESPMIRAVFSVLREVERRAQSVIPYWNLPGASTLFKDQKYHEDNLMLLNAVLDELIRNAMKFPPEEEDGHLSLLQYLVVTKKQDCSTKQLRDDLMTLLIAGHETTAALLTWALHELMKPKNKSTLDKVLAEIDSVVGDRPFEFEDMAEMPVMKWVLLETLRLYPEPPLLIRRCTEGDEIPVGPMCKDVRGDSVNILPGQDIFISTWSLQRSTVLWGEDANEFDPFRWERPIPAQGRWGGYNPAKAGVYPNETATDFAFLPFGGGPRKCVGDNFALLEAEVVLVNLLRRFSFKAAAKMEGQKMGMTTGATIHTLGGLVTEIRPREKPAAAASAASAASASPAASAAVPAVAPPLVMEKNMSTKVAQRIEPENMTVPTAKELRLLFTEQAMSLKTDMVDTEAIDAAYEKCREVTREYSKTFFLGSQLLDIDEQRAVWAIYNWCRSTDELVDGPKAATTTMADLEDWEEKLQAMFKMSTKKLVSSTAWEDLSMADSIRTFSLIQRPFQDMIGGMAMDLVKERYETFQELEVYCYRVAGTVGVMTLPVLGFDGMQNFTQELQEQTIKAAMSLGLAFQLTNILRDVGEDARRGRIYVPREDLERFGITQEEVIEAANKPGLLYHEDRWRDFMEFQFERCQRYYDEAVAGIVGLNEVNRLGVMAALFVYGAIQDAVRKNNYDNFSRRAYVPLNEKVVLMGKAWWRVQELQKTAEENVRSGRIFARSVAKGGEEAA